MKLLESNQGRRKKYSPELVERLLNALACGRTLVSVCEELGISPDTVYSWTNRYPDFRKDFARARDFGDEVLEDSVLEIADAEHISEEQIVEKTGKKITIKKRRFDNVHRSRLRVEARLKIVARRKGGLQNRRIEIEDDRSVADLSDAMKGMSVDDLMRFAGLTDDTDGE